MLHGLQTSEYGTYTNITEDKLNPPSLSELLRTTEEIKRDHIASMARAFVGIPVEVDDTLTGGNIKIMVSREMYEELEKREKAGK